MVDNVGNVLWARYVDYGADEFVGAVIVDSQERIVFTGYTGTNNTGNKRLIATALDGNGNYLHDVVIADGDFLSYGLYGFDIVETNADQPEYIIAGTGVDDATAAANKYAFVLKYVPGGGIPWGRIYQSTGPNVTTNFDSFTHILKVDDHQSYGEVYLLTGSGMEDSNSTQIVTNDLIDPYNNGLSVWNLMNAQGHRELDLDFNNFGVMSLYRQFTNKFYVMYYGKENTLSLMLMDGNSGSGSNLVSFYPWQGSFDYQNNFINGMVWRDNNQENIVFSGYHLEPTLPPGNGFPFLAQFTFGLGSTWTQYPTIFNGVDYQNIAFDFIAQPINYANPIHPEMLNQIYYHPKALVLRSAEIDYVFAEPWQDKDTGLFGLALFQTGAAGEMACGETIDCLIEGATLINYNNFTSSSYSFEVRDPRARVYDASVVNSLICEGDEVQQRPMEVHGSKKETGFRIYPNPAKHNLYISGLANTNKATITLYDLQGKKVLSKNHQTGNEAQLNVSTLESGLYFLKVSEGGESVFVERVVKK